MTARKLILLLAVAGLWLVTGWWVIAVHPLTGPVLLTITETNGVHLGDVPAAVLLVAVTARAFPAPGAVQRGR